MSYVLPAIVPSPHVLSDERKAQIRRDVRRSFEPHVRHDFVESPEYVTYCETHTSDGRPLIPEYATWRPGIVTCSLCDELTDGEDLCPKCLGAVEPYRDEPPLRVVDPNGIRL